MSPIACLVFCLFGILLSTRWAEGLQPESQVKARCPTGSYFYQEGVRWYCFEYFDDYLSFEDAEAVCQQLGNDGHLASLTNEAQTRLLGGYLTQATQSIHYVRIGLHRNRGSDIKNSWRWIDGTRYQYTSWKAGEPNNVGGEEFCGVLAPETGYKGWVDFSCDIERPFLCKWRPS